MSLTHKLLEKFSLFDLIIIAMMAALGVAIKPVVVPLAHLITGPLFIPGGAAGGGFYMMWIILAAGLTGKRGAATLTALIQALLVMSTGLTGSHGALSLITYTAPGILADLGLLLIGHRACCLPCAFLAGMLANLAGTGMTNLIYFRLPFVPLMLSLCTAALSGGLGGIVAYGILKQLKRLNKENESMVHAGDLSSASGEEAENKEARSFLETGVSLVKEEKQQADATRHT